MVTISSVVSNKNSSGTVLSLTITYSDEGMKFVPPDPNNTDYQNYLTWAAIPGNTTTVNTFPFD